MGEVMHCRSCGAAVVWMKTESGKNMPVDAETVKPGGPSRFDRTVHTSHFATCPNAAKHRRRK